MAAFTFGASGRSPLGAAEVLVRVHQRLVEEKRLGKVGLEALPAAVFLAECGAREEDLESLRRAGYVACVELTVAGRLVEPAARRSFSPLAAPWGRPGMAILLTGEGTAWIKRLIRSLAAAPADEVGQALVLPRWDGRRRELWYGERLVKHFQRVGAVQECILTSFERRQWPESIENPLAGRCEAHEGEKLHNAVTHLNRTQDEPLLHFRAARGDRQVNWSAASA